MNLVMFCVAMATAYNIASKFGADTQSSVWIWTAASLVVLAVDVFFLLKPNAR